MSTSQPPAGAPTEEPRREPLSAAARIAQLEHELEARTHELEAQRRFVAQVVDSLPVGLYVVDRAYRIHMWNRTREMGLQGIARLDAIGRTIFDVLNRQPADLLKREFDEVFASGELQQFQMESTATGERRTYRISKIPMRLDGAEVSHVITIGEDLTLVRAAFDRSAQAEKLAALGQLAAGAMHEINNPLATIAACAETIALSVPDDASGSGTADLLRIIDLEVHRCKRIVDGLLDFSRPRPSERRLLTWREIVDHTLFLVQHHGEIKARRLVRMLDAHADEPLLVDRDQLVQVVMAMLWNSTDATPHGAEIRVETVLVPSEAGALALQIVDTGHGMSPAVLARAFEPFFSTKATGKGTGLGLSICYGIVRDHGGRIELESLEGVGTTVRLILPRATSTAATS
jgi:two-component system NtrC family sensor kinase